MEHTKTLPTRGDIVIGFTVRAILGIILIVCTAGYMIPAVIAMWLDQRNTAAIFVLNIFLGWTVLGWIVALIWAATK